MGCDIHIHVEYKKQIYIGRDKNNEPQYEEKWLCGDSFYLNPHFGKFKNEEKYTRIDFCGDRNYSRFATLANVRNYGDTPYIDNPRGLPEDVTYEVKKECDEWDIDGHSHSFFTLKELIDYQKNIKPLRHRGMISPEAQKKLDENGTPPDMWCQWTSQTGWERREWETENNVLVPLIEALKQKADELYVISHWMWENDFEKACERANNIRIVFWFDN